ncbi:TVP38/TMEM64 family protein [Paractinoplanes hotanensis]|uniref:TVP38/TMEM64 family membrane protein n=1 Tax=Paractinoplanes hotanensis TaxID=2906497 RepID=A0ABT0Y666_9ACTN|nr:VTT domain-containing protein [Actinoplanes hotanensis]MCM4081518.1 VTT domain-containing protein [Actinoplanes hotanensis]
MTDILIAPRGAQPALDSQVPQPSQQHSATSMGWKRRLIRFGILGLVVATVAVAAAVLPLQDIADQFARLGPAAAVVMAVVGGLLLSVLVPRTAITLACGAVLGAATGAATALAAAVIAAAATYYAGRWVGRGALSARTGGRLERLDGWLNRRGLSAVLLVRFLPLAPFGLIGYAYGTTSVCRKRYLLGTTLASIPSAVSYAVIGAAVVRPGEMSPLSLAPALIGFTLTTSIIIWWKRSAKKAAATAAPATA